MSTIAYLTVLGVTVLGQATTAPSPSGAAVAVTDPAAPPPVEQSGWAALNAPRLFDLLPPVRDFRKALEDRGISLSITNALIFQTGAGGAGSAPNHNAFRTTDNLWIGLSLDFGKLTGSEVFNGLSLFILQDGGYGLSYERNVGALNALPNSLMAADAYQTQLSEYWLNWTRTFDKLTLRGRIGSINYARTFGGNAYSGDPTQQFINYLLLANPFLTTTTRNWYALGLGVEGQIDYQFAEGLDVSFASGVYSTNYGHNYSQFVGAFAPTGAQGEVSFPNPAYNGRPENPHALWLNEFAVRAALLDHGNGKLPGNYRFGFVYTDNPALDLGYNTYGGALPARYKSQSTAFYLSFDQLVYKEKADSDTEGLGVFFKFAGAGQDWGTPPTQIPFSTFFSFGAQYTGLIPNRDKDVLGIGYAISSYNQSAAHNGFYGNGSPELSDSQVIEAYYKINVFDWLQITPDVQYIIRPDGQHNNTNAFVVGLRTIISF